MQPLPQDPAASHERPTDGMAQRGAGWFVILLLLIGLAMVLGWGARATLDPVAGWIATGAVAVLAALAGSVLLDWQVLDELAQRRRDEVRLRDAMAARQALEDAAAHRLEQHRRLRHDLRGALSPALLTADRLLTNADPAVQRAGKMMVMAVERASELMSDPADLPTGPLHGAGRPPAE